jgi:citrate lyase beta subunit
MSLPFAGVRFTDAVRRAVTYLHLGASLYMPATRPDLRVLLTGRKYPTLRSVVVCTEDAVHPRALPSALANLRQTLPLLGNGGPLRFLRPRDPQVLASVIEMPGAEHLDGVSLSKLDESNVSDYLSVLEHAPWLAIMPIIETDVAFSVDGLTRLRACLNPVRERIPCVRVGGNDLLQLMGMKRPTWLTAYDTPLRLVIDNLIVAFRPHGYEVSAPVFEHIERVDVLAREVEIDVAHGLFAKTAIHPNQVAAIEAAYAVNSADVALADAILDPEAAAVFRFKGTMAEPTTHARWARSTRERAAVYGSILPSMCGAAAS